MQGSGAKQPPQRLLKTSPRKSHVHGGEEAPRLGACQGIMHACVGWGRTEAPANTTLDMPVCTHATSHASPLPRDVLTPATSSHTSQHSRQLFPRSKIVPASRGHSYLISLICHSLRPRTLPGPRQQLQHINEPWEKGKAGGGLTVPEGSPGWHQLVTLGIRPPPVAVRCCSSQCSQ